MAELDESQTDMDAGTKEAYDLWFALIDRALKRNGFDALCTLLRPRAMHGEGWDVLDEAETTFEDFNWMLETAQKIKGKETARRFAIYYYCFVIEMTAVHEIMINIFRCIADKHYLPFPFEHLHRRKSKGNRYDVPPSMRAKLREIKNLVRSIGEADLVAKLDYVYDEDLRNCIAHSDYILFKDHLRAQQRGSASLISLKELDRKINYTFRFLSGLLKAVNSMKLVLAKGKKYHQWDNYEVLELLSDENGVYGFNVHFSNGSKSTFARTKMGVTQINMRTHDGVGFMVGMLENLEPVWKVNGVTVTDWDELNRTST